MLLATIAFIYKMGSYWSTPEEDLVDPGKYEHICKTPALKIAYLKINNGVENLELKSDNGFIVFDTTSASKEDIDYLLANYQHLTRNDLIYLCNQNPEAKKMDEDGHKCVVYPCDKILHVHNRNKDRKILLGVPKHKIYKILLHKVIHMIKKRIADMLPFDLTKLNGYMSPVPEPGDNPDDNVSVNDDEHKPEPATN